MHTLKFSDRMIFKIHTSYIKPPKRVKC